MRRQIAAILLLAMVLTLLPACGGTAETTEKETRLFTDSCGREVEVPVEITAVVPSGSLAQMVLYTLCPDKLQSLATALTKTQKQYISEDYWDLPVTGQFYGGAASVNYEAIMAAAPDLIIDVGEAKDTIADDMDALQQDTGIPVIFIEASLETMADAYETLGDLLGVETQAADCAAYIRETLDDAARVAEELPESDRKRVLYAQGEYGTEVLGVGSIHAEVLDVVSAINVAELSAVASDGGNEVSLEQIMLWDPEVLILSPDANYDEIFDDPAWASVTAVQTGAVYEVPNGPYNWMDRPPSVQRVLAVKWLGNLLYPDLFDYDMIAETQTFYQLFFHCTLTEAEVRTLLENSTYREW
jgi:iron complex transport system substrate-binding protein